MSNQISNFQMSNQLMMINLSLLITISPPTLNGAPLSKTFSNNLHSCQTTLKETFSLT